MFSTIPPLLLPMYYPLQTAQKKEEIWLTYPDNLETVKTGL